MGGSEYWNGPTRPPYPFWSYCNRSDPKIPNSGCWAPPLPHDECSDTHGPAGDAYRPIEITGSAIGGWFGPIGDHEHVSAQSMWQDWLGSVGVGGGWILNLPPTVTGQIPAKWAAPALAFGKALRASFAKPVARLLLHGNTSVACGRGAPPLLLAIPPGTGAWNSVRSSEDVFHNGQLVAEYFIEAELPLADSNNNPGRRWENVTTRGKTVGVGTVDQAVLASSRVAGGLQGASQLRWSCKAAAGGVAAVTLSAVDLYMAHPPA